MKVVARLLVLAVLVALVASPGLLAAGASSDHASPEVLAVHKSVVARADQGGSVAEAQLLTRLMAAGDGPATVVDPTSTDRLRDLDRLLPPRVRDGAAVWDLDLEPDDAATRRSLARFPADDLPVVVSARYTLDGEPIAPSALDGETGRVVAHYRLRNTTATSRWIAYGGPDGPQTEQVSVAVPFVAGLTVDLGPGWDTVDADVASVTATSEGTRVLWTTALFEPLGALERELRLVADLDGGTVPDVLVEAVPVTRASSDRLEAGERLMVDGQSESAVLGFGLEEGTEAMHEIADGVGELLDGLVEAVDALEQIAEGIDGTAEGAGQLADGTGEAADGADELAGALDGLADGAAGLADGAAGLADGTAGLAEGLGELDAGTGELADGAAALADGLAELGAGLHELLDELEGIADDLEDLEQLVPGLEDIRDGIDGVAAVLADPSGPFQGGLTQIRALADQAIGLLDDLKSQTSGVDDEIDAVIDLVEDIDATAAGLADGLDDLADDLGDLSDGMTNLIDLLDVDGTDGEFDDLDELREAIDAVVDGAADLAEGVAAIDDGMGEAAGGAQGLAGGADELAGGAGELAGGADQAAEGTDELAGGLAELADGAGELTSALVELAGGTEELAEGLGEAVDGVEELEGGIETLADEAIDLLRRAADERTGELSRDLARLVALDERAGDGVPYGVPEGAAAAASYRIELAGTDPAPLPPAGRLLAGLLVLGLAGTIGGGVARRTLRPV